MTLLELRQLTVKFPTRFGDFTAIEHIDLTVQAGEIHGLVGESGAGKSTIGAAIIGLLQSPGYIDNGNVLLQGENLRSLDKSAYHKLRGNRISMIFQDPQTSLNPLLTVADQLIETIRQHSQTTPEDAHAQAIALLEETGLSDARERMHDFPHQFSGGMRQRVVIALALCTNPELIIADEPTTALDVAVQKQILALLKSLARDRGVGFILITHDIGVIAEITDKVTVLRSGRVIESGDTRQVLMQPSDDYTRALMAAVPRMDLRLDRFRNIVDDDDTIDGDDSWQVAGASAELASDWLLSGHNPTHSSTSQCKTSQDTGNSNRIEPVENATDHPPVLSVKNLEVTFYSNQPGWFREKSGFKALTDISFDMRSGEVLGIVGESGSGKSTLAKAIVGLVDPSAGSLQFRGQALPAGSQRQRKHPARREIQMVFQDPYSSLNNRLTVESIIAEPIRFYKLASSKTEIRKLVASVLDLVEMPQRAMLKYPHQFSGGQRQRIAVARALVARPEFLICDEPTSALDVSIQAQILNLLKDLQEAFGLSILFISHNLAVIRQMTDRLLVFRNGVLVEASETEKFFTEPQNPYSQQLLRETPSLSMISGQI
ncbi:ABC transporter ATP-binding protein [Chromatiales bacterium (ex Bugula neritina AB1)]|nr:ABC transporter ATP-binding protein [Chromatiales bacterium (ex Bugula neritina AB1)]